LGNVWECAVDGLTMFNIAVLLVEHIIILGGLNGNVLFGCGRAVHALAAVNFVGNSILAVSILAKIWALGFDRFWHRDQFRNRLDVLTVFPILALDIFLIVVESLIAAKGDGLGWCVIQRTTGICVGGRLRKFRQCKWLLRLVRSVRPLYRLAPVRVLFQLVGGILPIYRNLLGLLYLIFYAYTVVGMHLWGGLLEDGSGVETVLNFDSYFSAYTLLWHMMFAPIDPVIVKAFGGVTGNLVAWAFFGSFFLWINMIGLNIALAFCLDAFSSASKQDQLDTRQSAASVGDAAQRGHRQLFNKTLFLSGLFSDKLPNDAEKEALDKAAQLVPAFAGCSADPCCRSPEALAGSDVARRNGAAGIPAEPPAGPEDGCSEGCELPARLVPPP